MSAMGGDANDHAGNRAPGTGILHAANDMRHVAVDFISRIRITIILTGFERNDSRETIPGIEGVADEIGVEWTIRDEIVGDRRSGIAVERHVSRFILTYAEAAELNPGEVQRGRGAFAVRIVPAGLGEGRQGAELGFRAGPGTEREASTLVIGVVIRSVRMVGHAMTAVGAIANADVITDITADAQAGFGSRNVEVARAVGVADADVFHRFRLGDDFNSVGSTSTGHCDQSRS